MNRITNQLYDKESSVGSYSACAIEPEDGDEGEYNANYSLGKTYGGGAVDCSLLCDRRSQCTDTGGARGRRTKHSETNIEAHAASMVRMATHAARGEEQWKGEIIATERMQESERRK